MPEQERKYPPMHHIKIMLSRLWQCADRTRDRLLFPGCDFAAWVTQEAAGFTPEQGNQYQPSTNALPQVLRRFPITSGDRILLLSTCAYSYEGARFVVLGKLVEVL